jgi:hypothetical protein
MFHDPVRVPDEAGLGKAKITVSFDAWKEGHVAPGTFELPVVKPDPVKKATAQK